MVDLSNRSWIATATCLGVLAVVGCSSAPSSTDTPPETDAGSSSGSGSSPGTGSASGSGTSSGSGSSTPPSGDAGGEHADGSADGDGGLSLAERTAAVNATTTSDPLCTALGDFFWLTGDATGTLGSGAVGTKYTATTPIEIASASKFVFGAYMIESTQGNLTTAEQQELRMLSGYYGLDPKLCGPEPTVEACLNAGTPGPNYSYNAAYVGQFYYGGAHDEFFANTTTANGGLGLGSDTTAELNALILPVVKSPGFSYGFPEFAGGLTSTPAAFGAFLQSIVAGKLLIHDYLGVNSVCTLPSSCPTAISSPIPLAWHYSYNHWVEDDPTSDGAFSSAGAFGFYPWISKNKQLWGVLARSDPSGGNGDGAGGTGYQSAACGLKMRTAWNTGVKQ